jgi:hypothetical protein
VNFRDKRIIPWLLFIASVFLIKAIFLLIDHRPMFFLGDSAAYIATAVSDKIPTDRSFTFGYLIRLIAVPAHSLTAFVAFQAVLSAANCILLALILRQFLSVRRRVVFTMGLFSAVEPLQLMYERYILTETFALLLFAMYILLMLGYLRQPRLVRLLFIQLLAAVMISIRMSLLLVVVINAFALPVLAYPSLATGCSLEWKPTSWIGRRRESLRLVFKFAAHGLVSVGLLYAFITGYKHLDGYVSQGPPALQYCSGFFLLADWAPVVEPQDFPKAEARDAIFGTLQFDLKDRKTRADQRWHKGGLVRNIRNAFPNLGESEHLARMTANHAFRRNPRGVTRLALATFMDYFDRPYLKECMLGDRGVHAPDAVLMANLRKYFNWHHAPEPGTAIRTLTGSIFFRARPWFCSLLFLPVLGLVTLAACRPANRPAVFMILLSSAVIVGTVSALAEKPIVRYLHPLAWTFFLFAGILVDRLLPPRLTTEDGTGR